MKLFLCSHFSSVGSLIKEEIDNKKVAFIPTASLREGYTGYVGSARKLFNKLGAAVTEIDISTEAYLTINISDNGHEKYSYPSLDTPFEESMGIGYSKIDREIPIELNKEIPICVKIGTSSNRMEVLDITEDFRKIECDAGIAVTITVSDEIVE